MNVCVMFIFRRKIIMFKTELLKITCNENDSVKHEVKLMQC